MRPLEPLFRQLPVVYAPEVVYDRLAQLWRVAYPPGNRGAPWQHQRDHPPGLLRAAAQCGLEWPDGRISSMGGACVRCPQCGRLAALLYGVDGAWGCPTHCAESLTRLEQYLGEYVCALRIGLLRETLSRRHRTLVRLLATLAQVAKRPAELRLLGLGGLLMQWRFAWSRRRRLSVHPRGPVYARLVDELIPAAIDQMLHRDAYLARFG